MKETINFWNFKNPNEVRYSLNMALFRAAREFANDMLAAVEKLEEAEHEYMRSWHKSMDAFYALEESVGKLKSVVKDFPELSTSSITR
jgi:hypothetical protein